MINLYSIEFWVISSAITVSLLAAFGSFARWCSAGLAVPQKKLDALHVGMTTDEVRALLGRPREMSRAESGAQYWAYGARMKRHVLAVEFNASGRLSKFVHGVPDYRHPKKMHED